METPYLEWIGTGSGLNPVLGNTSCMIRGAQRTLLVDCGGTVPIELIKSGQIGDVTDILITHIHADHVGGLEGLGFMNYFGLRRTGDARPHLYVASADLAHSLWSNTLSGGMIHGADSEGNYKAMILEDYFKVHIGPRIQIEGLPDIHLIATPHVPHMENYGVMIGDDVYYSGDTTALPPRQPRLIFQDCQFFEGKGDVHISYDRLKKELPSETKEKTYLVHIGGGWEKRDRTIDGFAGFVKPRDKFTL
jgi:ribonuclease BN (tRNA processing enzyme)